MTGANIPLISKIIPKIKPTRAPQPTAGGLCVTRSTPITNKLIIIKPSPAQNIQGKASRRPMAMGTTSIRGDMFISTSLRGAKRRSNLCTPSFNPLNPPPNTPKNTGPIKPKLTFVRILEAPCNDVTSSDIGIASIVIVIRMSSANKPKISINLPAFKTCHGKYGCISIFLSGSQFPGSMS